MDIRNNAPGAKSRLRLRFKNVLLVSCSLLLVFVIWSCGVYKFNEATIPPEIKLVKVELIDNRARYINPQLGPRLTDKLRQKIVGQTRLSQTNGDNADWEISGRITDYSFNTAAISGQQTATNRLSVTVHITKYDRVHEKTDDFDVSRSFDFKGTQSFQQAESDLFEEMMRTLTDDIFNKLFSNW